MVKAHTRDPFGNAQYRPKFVKHFYTVCPARRPKKWISTRFSMYGDDAHIFFLMHLSSDQVQDNF